MKTEYQILAKDKTLKHIIEGYDSPKCLPARATAYESLIFSIVGQQISTKAAQSIGQRLSHLVEMDFSPPVLLRFSIEDLKSVGLSTRKAEYVHNVSRYFIDERIDDDYLISLSDEEVIARLTTIKGIGQWSVEMLLIFHFDRPDVFPAGDLAIQYAMKHLYQLTSDGSKLKRDMQAVAEQWRPYRSLASRYLWVFYGNKLK